MITFQPKVDMVSLPPRMAELRIDKRGYPVPWFVAWVNGEPEFRAVDPEKYVLAVRDKRCWVCGHKLGVHATFVAGPMCGINRTSSEPPCHYECALWSAKNCPFLSNPRQVRREDERVNNARLTEAAPGIALTRNLGVAMLWRTREYQLFPDDRGRYLIRMGEPVAVEWYAEGRPATRAEVQESIDSGLPNLELLARQEKGGMEALGKAVERFSPWLPKV